MPARLPVMQHTPAAGELEAPWCDGSAELKRQPQNELPQAQPPPAFGLSISKPCFSMVSV